MVNRLISISELFSIKRSKCEFIARREKKLITWLHFQNDTEKLIGHLQQYQGKRILLYCDDCYSFAVGICAIWFSGAVAVLPPNAKTETLSEIIKGVDCFITDLTFQDKKIAVINPFSIESIDKEFIWNKPDKEQLCIEIYTSGSAGNRKIIPKKIKHLEEEIVTLESVWGNQVQNKEFIATVSHQHIYGFLFKFLWPICSGRIFHSSTYFYPENLLLEMNRIKNCCLISSPAHLKRMPELINIEKFKPLTTVIFSSGGPLNPQTAEIYIDNSGITPIEIFGSTETGGVAWKQHQKGEKPYWQALPGVEVKVDDQDCLYVRSAVVSVNSVIEWFRVGDQVEMLSNQKFTLKGRGDRIIKIEEKRLSLEEMERILKNHPQIEDAKVFTLESDADTPKRVSLATVIVLSNKKQSQFYAPEKKRIIQELKVYLNTYFDSVLIPRFWRIVDQFPEDAQGKTPLTVLHQLFAQNNEPKITNPEILEETIENNYVLVKFKVPEGLYYLKDHFPKAPIVPGFIQIKWIFDYITKIQRHERFSVKSLEVLKFHKILQPNDIFNCEIRFDIKNRKFVFKTWNDEKKFCSGRAFFQTTL
jgi:acyl-coenzyme A synthetase/AMP-(fatty) acid ligase/3-hydroxymyristoyl/3-hydroxydecanoyl-(acyl carrier protein) dehydratase